MEQRTVYLPSHSIITTFEDRHCFHHRLTDVEYRIRASSVTWPKRPDCRAMMPGSLQQPGCRGCAAATVLRPPRAPVSSSLDPRPVISVLQKTQSRFEFTASCSDVWACTGPTVGLRQNPVLTHDSRMPFPAVMAASVCNTLTHAWRSLSVFAPLSSSQSISVKFTQNTSQDCQEWKYE